MQPLDFIKERLHFSYGYSNGAQAILYHASSTSLSNSFVRSISFIRAAKTITMNISIDHSCSSSATSATGVGMATNKKDEDGTCYNENYDETQQHRTQTDDCHDATYQIAMKAVIRIPLRLLSISQFSLRDRKKPITSEKQHSYYPKYGRPFPSVQ